MAVTNAWTVCCVVAYFHAQLTYRYEQLRLQVVDFHVSVLTTCLQRADYLAGLTGDPNLTHLLSLANTPVV